MKTVNEIVREQGFREFTKNDLYAYAGADPKVNLIRRSVYADYILTDLETVDVIFNFTTIDGEVTNAYFTVKHPEIVNWDVLVEVIDDEVAKCIVLRNWKNKSLSIEEIERRLRAFLTTYGYKLQIG